MQASRHWGFGFLQGERGPRFWRQLEPSSGRCPHEKGRARALYLLWPIHLIVGREAASAGGRRDLTLAPSQAAGGDGYRPGGSSGDHRGVVYTKVQPERLRQLRTTPWGWIPPPPPARAFRPAANEWLPQRAFCGPARILLSSRACPAFLPPRRVPGVSPSCSALVQRTASFALAWLRPGAYDL